MGSESGLFKTAKQRWDKTSAVVRDVPSKRCFGLWCVFHTNIGEYMLEICVLIDLQPGVWPWIVRRSKGRSNEEGGVSSLTKATSTSDYGAPATTGLLNGAVLSGSAAISWQTNPINFFERLKGFIVGNKTGKGTLDLSVSTMQTLQFIILSRSSGKGVDACVLIWRDCHYCLWQARTDAFKTFMALQSLLICR